MADIDALTQTKYTPVLIPKKSNIEGLEWRGGQEIKQQLIHNFKLLYYAWRWSNADKWWWKLSDEVFHAKTAIQKLINNNTVS